MNYGLSNGREPMKNNELAWGNADSILAWRLPSGAIHVTDASNASNACATGYFDFLTEWKWFGNMLAFQDLSLQYLLKLWIRWEKGAY